jgi:hypothetical protein
VGVKVLEHEVGKGEIGRGERKEKKSRERWVGGREKGNIQQHFLVNNYIGN